VMMSTREAAERLPILHGGAELQRQQNQLFFSGLERMIDQALIMEEFQAEGLQIPERLIDDHINEIVLERYNNDRASLLEALAQEQITVEEWRQTIRERIIVRMMRSREVGERIIISPLQIRETYEARQDRYLEPEKVRIRLIFTSHGGQPEQERERLARAREDILAGGSFATQAREISEDPSAPDGGNWGWIEPVLFRKELMNAVSGLNAGEVSEIVETPEGLYLLQIEERREASSKSFEEMRREIEVELRDQQAEQLYRDWIARLRNKYSVIYHIPVPPES